jgi:predicted DNA-binding transcriptional regulator AlpA
MEDLCAERPPVTLRALRADLVRLATESPPEELPALIGRLEAAKATAWARLVSPAAPNGSGRTDSDENLSAAATARRLGVSVEWVYRNARRLPFSVRIGRRVLFSAAGLERWNRQQKA